MHLNSFLSRHKGTPKRIEFMEISIDFKSIEGDKVPEAISFFTAVFSISRKPRVGTSSRQDVSNDRSLYSAGVIVLI
jgi:hypothetical protein